MSAIPHLYAPLEDALFPILDRFTCQDGLDVFEEVTKIITYLTYYAPEITPRMWSLYPKLLHCMDTWAIDYFPDVLLPLDNYISRGSDVFLGAHQPSLLDMTNNTLQKVLAMGHGGSEEEAPDDAIISAAQLMSVIMQHCRGRVDHCIGKSMGIHAFINFITVLENRHFANLDTIFPAS